MTTTRSALDWRAHAQRLAGQLVASGDIRTPRWRDAIAAVPRHLLVPTAYEQDHSGRWTPWSTVDDLDRVYSPETLITDIDPAGIAVSSSTKPDLMARMLELLDARPGHRVLEVGTGTGYNAALLSHALGDEHVHSVDIDPDLVDAARARLAAIGYRPTLAAVDGAAGLPEHGPYDRIIATCSVPRVPWAWAQQLADDGVILADVKVALSAGNLVRLTRETDGTLTGRFTTRWAGFMAMRHHTAPTIPGPSPTSRDDATTRPTSMGLARVWETPPLWFLVNLWEPQPIGFGITLDPATRQPSGARYRAEDGSWCEITSRADRCIVTEGGPRRLWSNIEHATTRWRALGEPGWDRLGLTVSADQQTVWVDHPDGPAWNLLAERR